MTATRKIRAEFVNVTPITLPYGLEASEPLKAAFSEAVEAALNETISHASSWPVDAYFPLAFGGQPHDALTVYVELPICEDGANEHSDNRPVWEFSLRSLVEEIIEFREGEGAIDELTALRDGFTDLASMLDDALNRES